MPTATPLLEEDALRTFLGPEGRWASETGQRVRQRRKDLNFTLDQVATFAGTTLQTIARIEAGKIVPRDRLKVAIAVALFVEPGELWPWPSRQEALERAGAVA